MNKISSSSSSSILFKSAVVTSAAASCGCKRMEGQMSSEKSTAWQGWGAGARSLGASQF